MVVPEVNAHTRCSQRNRACPECSTIQMIVALGPVRQKWGLDHCSTYQAVSGAGMGTILETQRELREVLNDSVKRDLHAEICLQVVTETLSYRL